MNKKLICLLLSVIMLLSVILTSCGQKSDEETLENISEEASASAITLSMYLMSEAPVSAKQEAAIEAAINALTMSKFKAKLDLTFLTKDEYYKVLEENLAKQAENAGLYYTEDDVALEGSDTKTDDLGNEVVVYPDLRPNQVDIFYFSGYDKYSLYMENEYLNELDEQVDNESKALKSYVAKALLQYMKSVNEGIYAIPTNRPIGNYTYLLLNKEVLEKTYYGVDDRGDVKNGGFNSLTCENVQDILNTVATDPSLNTKYVPLHSFTGELDVLNYQYWGVDENGFLTNQFSVLGGAIDTTWTMGAQDAFPKVNPIFNSAENQGLRDQLSVLNLYKYNGYYNPEAVAAGKDFAVGYIKGGPEVLDTYGEDYAVIPVAMPTLETTDLYKDLFAVSAHTVELKRSMDVITYLNTNEEFRNLLLYGIEGENYDLVMTEVGDNIYKQVKRLNSEYQMDINKTGNVLLAYTTVDQNPLLREYAKQQNRDAQPSYVIGLQLEYADMAVNMKYFKSIREYSKQVFDALMENPGMAPDQFTLYMGDKLQDNPNAEYEGEGLALPEMIATINVILETMCTENPERVKDSECPFAYLYYNWLFDKGMYVPVVEETN